MSILEFQKSITKELDVVKNRVRNLIGNRNWGEEGRYKEAILKNAISSFLPKHLSIGTGFIMSNENDQVSTSKQLDIIIYDNTYPLLFSEGDFIITTINNVKGVIEVKSKINHNTCRTKNSLCHVINNFDESFPNINIRNRHIFLGLFSFEFDDVQINSENIDNAIQNSRGLINHISLGPNYFIKKWTQTQANNSNVYSGECAQNFYNIYNIDNLSFSYFISNLLDTIISGGLNERSWFSFPIEGTKEVHKLRSICSIEEI